MPDPCLVTVKAGPAHSKDYESFVGSSLREEVLQEITSNLENELRNEALNTFLDAVRDGLSIADCISRVQKLVLPKVPNERNKFFIKFVYDNKLQIEIGVNKFKNGNAQFYHKLGIQPRETPEQQEKKAEYSKRRAALQELRSEGGFPTVKLKKQVTNDRSAPITSVEQWKTLKLPPNPTNKQTSRAREDWASEIPDDSQAQRSSGRPRGLGHVFRAHPPSASQRSRSLGRPLLEREQSQSETCRDRSASPLGPGGVKLRGLGDCFRSGIRPSQARLRRASPSPARKTSAGTFELEKGSDQERLQNVRLNEKIVEPKQIRPNSVRLKDEAVESNQPTFRLNTPSKGKPEPQSTYRPNTPSKGQMKTIKIVIQATTEKESSSSASSSSSTSRSSSSSSLDEEWKKSCLEIEEIPESPTEIKDITSEPDTAADEPSVEFLQPSTVFITEAPEGRVEEPLDINEEYPIQNLRNRRQQNSHQTDSVFNKAFIPVEKASVPQEPSSQPFFSHPLSPLQINRWKEGMAAQSSGTTCPSPPSVIQEPPKTSSSSTTGWVNIPIQRL